jgi:hypothetical protein
MLRLFASVAPNFGGCIWGLDIENKVLGFDDLKILKGLNGRKI